MSQLTLEAYGRTYQPSLDQERLGRVDQVVLQILEDGAWHPRRELMDATHGAAVNSSVARIRGRVRFEGMTVASRRDPENPAAGNWSYRLEGL